jgi:hypothetical protein
MRCESAVKWFYLKRLRLMTMSCASAPNIFEPRCPLLCRTSGRPSATSTPGLIPLLKAAALGAKGAPLGSQLCDVRPHTFQLTHYCRLKGSRRHGRTQPYRISRICNDEIDVERRNRELQKFFEQKMDNVGNKRSHSNVAVLLISWVPEGEDYIDAGAEVSRCPYAPVARTFS